MTTLAKLQHVTKRFGAITALRDVSLEIKAGTILGLLGPNGAGKTTLLSLLQGLRRASEGSLELFGGNPADPASRRLLGSTPQETALPATLRVGEVIDFVGAHFEHRIATDQLAEQFGLGELLKRQTGSLSGGQKRRLSVAIAFVGNPRLVLLDEPTTGLDVDARRALWAALRQQHENGATIVVTSHYLEEIEALAERVIVMGEGKVLADDSLRGVLDRVGLRLIRLRSAEAARVGDLRQAVRHEQNADGSISLFARDSDEFIRELVASGLPFSDLTVRGATLEEAFLSLTENVAAEGAL